MKLRLRGSSLRLRLEQHEIKALIEKGEVAEFVPFAGGSSFGYALSATDTDSFAASFTGSVLRVQVPLSVAKNWADSDDEGMYQTLQPGTGFELKLAIEKDFQCLHKRPDEDETDLFPNPKANA